MRVGLVVLGLALVVPAAVLARGDRHRRPVHRRPAGGQVCAPHVKRVKGRCVARVVRTRGTALAAAEKGTFAVALAADRRLPAVPRRAYRRVPPVLRHGLPGLLTDRAAARVVSRAAGLVAARIDSLARAADAGPSVGGWTTQVNGTSGHDDDRLGDQDAQATITASKNAIVNGLAVSAEAKISERHRLLVDRCPSAQGTVPGDGIDRFTLSLSLASRGARASATIDLVPTFTDLGHVADTGKLRSFDAKLHFTGLVSVGVRGSDGRLYSQEPPRLYVVDIEHDGIDPDHPSAGYFQEHLGGRMTAHTFLGHLIWQDDVAPKLQKLAETLYAVHLDEVARIYKQAEQGWQTPGGCVHVALSTPSTTVAPSAAVPVTATITGLMQAGGHLAGGRYTATASDGTSTPASGSYSAQPLSLTYTAPASEPAGGNPEVTVTTQSKQGKGVGMLSVRVASSYALRYTHSSQLDYDGQPERVAAAPTSGTEDRHEQWALQSTVPLTGDPTTGLSGTGPLTFTTARYHLDWEGTFTGQGSCPGSDVEDLTGSSAGTAQVQKLTFSSPTSVSLRFDPGQQRGLSGALPPAPTENYTDVQTYDVCQGATNTSTESRWNSAWNYFYGLQGSDSDGVATIDSGWRPGTGNVVATRTVTGSFPWLGAPGTPATSTWTDTYQIIRQ